MPRAIPTEDSLAVGWEDDGSSSGVQRIRNTQPALVMVPFDVGAAELAGSSTPALRADAFRYNPDGSGSGVSVSLGVKIANQPWTGYCNYATVKFAFSGPVLALRWLKGVDSTNPPKDFSCVIDGIPYAIDNQVYEYYDGTTVVTRTQPKNCTIVSALLSEGPHECELVFNGEASTTNPYTQHWTLLGYAVAAGYGAQEQPRSSGIGTPVLCAGVTAVTITTTADFTLLSCAHANNGDAANHPRAIAGILLKHVGGGGAVTLTVWYAFSKTGNIPVTAVPIYTVSVADGLGEIITFPAPIRTDPALATGAITLLVSASVADKINCTPIGVF